MYLILLELYNRVNSLKTIKAGPTVFKAQFKANRKKIVTILTADQLVKYNSWMAKRLNAVKHYAKI